MKFSTREDIEAPIEVVFEVVSNFEAFELRALRRGADVDRLDKFDDICVGATWEVAFTFRHRDRTATAEVTRFEAPNGLSVASKSGGLEADLTVDLVQLSPKRTRLSVSVELAPQTLSARLLVQSLKLARSNLNKRFTLAVADFAQTIEKDHADPAKMA